MISLVHGRPVCVCLVVNEAGRKGRQAACEHLQVEVALDDPPTRSRHQVSSLDGLGGNRVGVVDGGVKGYHFVIRMLGAVGDQSTVARLRMLTKDPEAGRAAVDAIRQINRRDEATAAPARS